MYPRRRLTLLRGTAAAATLAPATASVPPRPAARPIIPLAHVPDDPGPEPEAILDVGLAAQPPAAWQRIRQLFR